MRSIDVLPVEWRLINRYKCNIGRLRTKLKLFYQHLKKLRWSAFPNCVCKNCLLQKLFPSHNTCFSCFKRILMHSRCTVFSSATDGFRVFRHADISCLLRRHVDPLLRQSQKLPSNISMSAHCCTCSRNIHLLLTSPTFKVAIEKKNVKESLMSFGLYT
jgi:hypothetical protein